MLQRVATTCRLCESSCGLVAHVDGTQVVRLEPDAQHPLSAGYACRKGTHFAQVHHDARRVTSPLWRTQRGDAYSAVGWEQALAKVGGRLRQLLAEHGPASVGLYLGNAAGHSLGTLLGATALQRGLRTHKNYSCLTLDNSVMFVVTEACLGNPMMTFVADYAGADLVVLWGTDPLSSQPSQCQSNPGGMAELRAVGRAGNLVVVDPRCSTTAKSASVHLAPRPGADVEVLAWLAGEAVALQRWRNESLLHADDIAAFQAALAGFDLARAAAASGLQESALNGLRDRLFAAERPLVWSGLGVLLGANGTLGYWLTLALQALLGGLDRVGGWLQQPGAVNLPALAARVGLKGRDMAVRSRVGNHPAILGTLAAATLADDILLEGPERLRALVVVGGNPALSLPDAPRAQQALAALDLLVSVDLFVNDTATLAHAVLPATTWLERPEVALHMANQRRHPHLQLAPAVVPPAGQARDDWWILTQLARAAGVPAFGSRAAQTLVGWGLGPMHVARVAVGLAAPFGFGALKRAERGIQVTPQRGAGLRLRGTAHGHGRLLLAVPEFVGALQAMQSSRPAPHVLQLVTSVRPLQTLNTWLQPSGTSSHLRGQASLNPADLTARGLADGDRVRIRPAGAAAWRLRTVVRADEGVRPGVMVLPFGWGHLSGAGMADGDAGGNANALVLTDVLEPFTGQPVSNGRHVEMEADR